MDTTTKKLVIKGKSKLWNYQLFDNRIKTNYNTIKTSVMIIASNGKEYKKNIELLQYIKNGKLHTVENCYTLDAVPSYVGRKGIFYKLSDSDKLRVLTLAIDKKQHPFKIAYHAYNSYLYNGNYSYSLDLLETPVDKSKSRHKKVFDDNFLSKNYSAVMVKKYYNELKTLYKWLNGVKVKELHTPVDIDTVDIMDLRQYNTTDLITIIKSFCYCKNWSIEEFKKNLNEFKVYKAYSKKRALYKEFKNRLLFALKEENY